jgi:hypothetical protein
VLCFNDQNSCRPQVRLQMAFRPHDEVDPGDCVLEGGLIHSLTHSLIHSELNTILKPGG